MTYSLERPFYVCFTCGNIDENPMEYFEDACLDFNCWKNEVGRAEARTYLKEFFKKNPPKTFEDTVFKAPEKFYMSSGVCKFACPEDGEECWGRGCRWCPDECCIDDPTPDL